MDGFEKMVYDHCTKRQIFDHLRECQPDMVKMEGFRKVLDRSRPKIKDILDRVRLEDHPMTVSEIILREIERDIIKALEE